MASPFARLGPTLGPVVALAGGAALGQALTFAARPLLTRLFTPEAWGAFTLVTTAAALLSAVAHGGYRSAVLLPADDRDAGALVGLACSLGLVAVGLTALGAGAAVAWGASPVWLMLPALLAAMEGAQTADVWLARRDRFGAVSRARVAQAAATVGVQAGAGALGGWALGDGLGLIAGAVAGFGVGAAWAGGAAWRADGALVRAASARAGVARVAARYRRFPAFSAPAALLNLAATRLTVLALAAFAGEAVVGQFGIAFGTLALPLGLVTGAAGQVFVARAAEARRAGALAEITAQTFRSLLAVTAFPAFAVLAAGPTLFAVVFGGAWAEAGRYAQLIAPWVLLASVASPLTALFDVAERQRADLSYSVAMVSVQAAVLLAAGLTLPPAGIVLASSAAGAALRAGHLAWMLRIAGVPAAVALRGAARALGPAVPLALGVWAADAALGGAWTLAATVLGGLAALALAARR